MSPSLHTCLAALALVGCGKSAGPGTGSGSGSGGSAADKVVAPPPPAIDAPPPELKPETHSETLEVEFLSAPVTVTADVPTGWIRRGKLTTWDPPNDTQLPMWHRSYEVTATCDGGCALKDLEGKIPRYLDAVIAHHKQPKMSGNADQDAKAFAPTKILERGDLPQGGSFVFLRVEKPPEFKTDPYPDIFAGTCVTRRPTDGFMVITHIQTAPDDETTWWPVLMKACKATTITTPK